MNELLDKISSYNVFNYLLPGSLFAVFATSVTSFSLIQDDLLTGAFVYYFIGLVVSRVGSLIVEPALRKSRLVTFAAYTDFVSASSKDSKLEVLSEVNNMYRALIALFLLLPIVVAFDHVARSSALVASSTPYLFFGTMLILFVLSYRKQTKYIYERIHASES